MSTTRRPTAEATIETIVNITQDWNLGERNSLHAMQAIVAVLMRHSGEDEGEPSPRMPEVLRFVIGDGTHCAHGVRLENECGGCVADAMRMPVASFPTHFAQKMGRAPSADEIAEYDRWWVAAAAS